MPAGGAGLAGVSGVSRRTVSRQLVCQAVSGMEARTLVVAGEGRGLRLLDGGRGVQRSYSRVAAEAGEGALLREAPEKRAVHCRR